MSWPRLLLPLLLTADLLSAATWYVAPAGNDGAAGSINAPLRTLDAAVARLRPGDRLLVRGGTYTGSIRIWDKRGSAGAPIRIAPYEKERVILDGRGAGSDAVVSIGRSSWVFLDAFEIRGGPSAGVLVYDSTRVQLRWNDIHHNGAAGVSISSSDATRRGTSHHVVVSGNRIHHNVLSNGGGKAANWSQAVAVFRAADVTVTRNYVYENHGEGIDAVLSDRVVIAANSVWDNFGVNIYLDNASNAFVDRNFVTTGRAAEPRRQYRDGRPAGGIVLANERYAERNPLHQVKITNNIVTFCRFGLAYGDWETGGGMHDVLVANNTFYGATEAALYLEPVARGSHSAVRFVNNIFFQRGQPYLSGTAQATSFRSNCWFGGEPATRPGGRGDVLADPHFLRAGGSDPADYRLAAGSPCVDRGAPAPPVRTDFAASPRRNAPDLGAWERRN